MSDENSISRQIVDAAVKVHSALGPGLLESVYEGCLHHELRKRGLRVHRQAALPVHYDGIEIESGFRLDLVVSQLVVVEIKAVDRIASIHLAQMLTYLKLGRFKLGLLLNFNVARMRDGIKRVANNL